MKKRNQYIIIITSSVIVLFMLVLMLCAVLSFRTLPKKYVTAFLEDTLTGMAYMPVYASESDSTGLTPYRETLMAASGLIARGEGELQEDGGYVVFHEKLQSELAAVFGDSPAFDVFPDSEYIYRNEYGDISVIPDPGAGNPCYTITDSFYGIIGSEPSFITVYYALYDEETGDELPGTGYTAEFTFVYDKGSPYHVWLTDIRLAFPEGK